MSFSLRALVARVGAFEFTRCLFVIALIFIPSLLCLFLQTRSWPYSSFDMYANTPATGGRSFSVVGLTADGKLVRVTSENNLFPIGPNGLQAKVSRTLKELNASEKLAIMLRYFFDRYNREADQLLQIEKIELRVYKIPIQSIETDPFEVISRYDSKP